MVIPIPKYEYSLRQAAKLGKMWSIYRLKVSEKLVLCRGKNGEVEYSVDLPIAQDSHQSPSDLEQALVCTQGGSGKKQERRRLQTMSSVPRQR